MGLQWDDAPPDRTCRIRIFRLGVHKLVYARLLDQPRAIKLHWVDGSMPCLGHECPWCPSRTYRRWYGPALVLTQSVTDFDPERHKRFTLAVVLELSEDNMLALEGLSAAGLIVELARGDLNTSPTRLTVCKKQDGLVPEPSQVWQVQPILERLWGIDAGKFAVKPKGERQTLKIAETG